MKKEVVTIQFRYYDEPNCSQDSGYREKTVLIGVFDTLKEAVDKGNEVIKTLSSHFEIRDDDCFKKSWIFGTPKRLVSNCCYPTNGVSYFANITQMEVDDIQTFVSEIFAAANRYKAWKEKEDNDD